MKRIICLILCVLSCQMLCGQEVIRLWEGDAPGAKGQREIDIPTITAFLPANPEGRLLPAVVICPGGAYSFLAKDLEGVQYAKYLNELGMAAFVLKYRVGSANAGGYRYPIPNQDAHRAIRMVRAQAKKWSINPQQIGIMGSSAGGHLAAMTAVVNDNGKADAADLVERQSSRPDFAILCYAQTSMDAQYGACAGSKALLIGGTSTREREVAAYKHVTEDTPPCFIWHTFADTTVPVKNALDMANALQENLVPYSLHIYHSGKHGLGLGGNPRHPWTRELAFWLQEIGVLRSIPASVTASQPASTAKAAPAKPAEAKPSAAGLVAPQDLTLSISFDQDTTAEIASGRATPTETRGKLELAEGLHGKALVSGKTGATMIYECKDNLNFDQPGTITLWIKANEDWHANPPKSRIVMWGLGNNGGYIGLSLSPQPQNVCICRRNMELAIYHSKVRRDVNYVLQPPALTKLCQGWHLVSLAWGGSNLYLSFDGAPYRAYKLEKPLSNAEFAHCTRFAFGYPSSSFLLDELRIYGKKLTDNELLQIWELGKK